MNFSTMSTLSFLISFCQLEPFWIFCSIHVIYLIAWCLDLLLFSISRIGLERTENFFAICWSMNTEIAFHCSSTFLFKEWIFAESLLNICWIFVEYLLNLCWIFVESLLKLLCYFLKHEYWDCFSLFLHFFV